MFRSFLIAFALIGTLAVAHPVWADPVAASVADSSQAAAHIAEQPAQSTAAQPSPATAGHINAGIGKGIAPVGFGWG
jgi:hypothetical protein